MGGKQVETEAEILARMNRENKKSVENIKNKMTEIDEAIDNASPGFAGDRKYDAQLVADDLAEKRFGKEFYDLDQKQQMDLYDEAYQGLSKQRFKQNQDLEKQFNKDVEEAGGMEEFLKKNPIDDDTGDFAQGGRAGFKSGGITALKSLLNYFAKQRGTKGSQQLKDINPKSVPSGIMNIMGPEHRKMLEKNQTDYIESLLDTIKSDKKFLDNKKRIAKQIQKDIDEAGFGDFTNAEKMMTPFIESAMKGDRLDRMRVYDKINVDDAIMDIEQMIKNRRMKESDGRALNSTGGRIGFAKGLTPEIYLKSLRAPIQGPGLEALELLNEEINEEEFLRILKDLGVDKKAEGGRAGFKTGLGKGFLEFISKQLKPRGKVKFDERRFREGPIDLDFLENIDKKDLAKFIRTRDTGGPGGYGMYDKFADMPAGLRAAELIKTIKTTDGGINYKAAELFLGKRLKGNESVDELIQMLNRQEMRADGGRIGYKDGPEIKLFPRARGSQVEQEVGPGIKISERDIDYGITGLLEGDKFFGGASIDKGKVKVDVITPEGDTLFKDTIGKDDAINFILGMGDPKGDKFEIRTDKDLENMQFIIKTSFADGGRIGLKEGSGMTRRSFLKLLGGLASLPIIGKFLKPAKVASKAVKAAPVVSKSTPPAYFFELAETIKKFGKPDKVTYQDRVEIHRYTGKNGDDYELIEDLSTGDMKITKDKTGIGTYGDKSYDTINDRSVMEYKKGRGDETTKGTPPDEYDEYKVEFDIDGTEAEADNMTEIVRKEIIEETKDSAPSIKKASGGIARMLGE